MNTEKEIEDALQLEICRNYAVHCHTETNHRYGIGLPYDFHLQMVYDFAVTYEDLFPDKELLPAILCACWTHDVIEDCRQTYNDVFKMCGTTVAEITYALTNEKGKNRKERANRFYYEGIRKAPGAVFVKLCDRLANINYSKRVNSPMLDMYRKEQEAFKQELFIHNIYTAPMFKQMDKLLK